MKKLSIIMSIFLMIFLSSCDMNITEIERQHNLEYITVDTSDNVKLTYLIGENLKTTGIKVIGHYSDETEQEEDIRLVTFSEMDNTKPSDSFPINIKFGGKETSYNVVILEAQVESISIQLPQKLFYQINEQLDTTGLKVYGKYTNGVTLELEETQYVIDSVDLSEYGPHWVYVRLASNINISEAYKIEVQDFTISSIEITSCPNRMIYMAGEELDLTGLVVTATTDKGRQTTLNKDQFTFSPVSIKDLEPSEKVEITVNVNELKASFDIKIVPGYVVGAVITKKETKEQIQDSNIIYCEGENFKLEDYDFYELLSNETLGNPIGYDNLQCDINNMAFVGEGIHTVNIKYNFEDVATREQKEYIIEMKVCVVDSELEKITAEWTDTGGYPLGLLPDNSNPEKYGKWKITGYLKNGNPVEITPNSCTYDFSQGLPEVEKDKENIINNNGAYFDVIVKYTDIRLKKDFESTYKVKVIPPVLMKVEILKYPTKLEYCVGDTVILNGLSVQGYYSDGSFKTIETPSYWDTEKIMLKTKKIQVFYSNEVFIDIPIKIITNYIIGISLIEKIGDSKIVFRKGKTYDKKTFVNNFDVKVIYYSNDNIDAGSIIEDVVFSIDFDHKRVNAVYQPGESEVTYSAYSVIKTDILHSLPKSVKILHPENILTISSVKDYVKNLSLDVEYEDDTHGTLIFNNENGWSDAAGSYSYELKGDDLIITFTATDNDINESKVQQIEFTIPFIKGIEINKKEGNSNENFRYDGSYDYTQYYDVNMVFADGENKKIENATITASFDKESAKTQKTDGYLIGTYEENGITYSCVYKKDVSFYPSRAKEIKVKLDYKESFNSQDEFVIAHYYVITYEDESSFYSNTSNSNHEKEICGPLSCIKETNGLKITCSINKTYNCNGDNDVAEPVIIEKSYTYKDIVVSRLNTSENTSDIIIKKDQDPVAIVKNQITSISIKVEDDEHKSIYINKSKDDFDFTRESEDVKINYEACTDLSTSIHFEYETSEGQK